MKRVTRSVGEYDVPLDLWPDESSPAEDPVETSVPRLDQHGAIEGLVDVPQGVSLSLGDRALALAEIMDYYNQANKTRGAKASPNAMTQRYGNRGSYEVVTNMNAKTNDLLRVANRAFEAITMHDQLVESGFESTDVQADRRVMGQELKREYGPGNAFAEKRAEAVKIAKKIAGLK